MKKIGILFGQEKTFPNALIDRINSKNVPGVTAEAVLMYHVEQGKASEYSVIIDRISQDVPFYRAYLKMQPYKAPKSSTIRFGGVPMKSF